MSVVILLFGKESLGTIPLRSHDHMNILVTLSPRDNERIYCELLTPHYAKVTGLISSAVIPLSSTSRHSYPGFLAHMVMHPGPKC